MTTLSRPANLIGILLAAGSSSRLGQSKQLLTFQGQTLLGRTYNILKQSKLTDVLVVLGAKVDSHKAVLSPEAQVCIHQQWERGMGSSLKYGLNRVMELERDIDGVLVSVCDQPYLSTNHINLLISSFQGTQLIASSYAGQLGVPAIFPKSAFFKILELNDEKGAKSLLKEAGEVGSVPFPKGEIDIDTEEDLNFFLSDL